MTEETLDPPDPDRLHALHMPAADSELTDGNKEVKVITESPKCKEILNDELTKASLDDPHYPNTPCLSFASSCKQESHYSSPEYATQTYVTEQNDDDEPMETDIDMHQRLQDEDKRLVTMDTVPVQETQHLGLNKGIRWENNSCYMDATLFCLFYCSKTFESILECAQGESGIRLETRSALKKLIVEPLQEEFFCDGNNTTKFREVVGKINPKLANGFVGKV